MIEIWENKLNKEKADTLPIIIPLVIYHGREKWNTEKTLGNLLAGYNDLSVDIQKHVPNYEYILYDFSLYNDEEIKGEAQLRIFLDILKHIFDKDVEQLMSTIERAAQVLGELETKQTGMEYFETYMRYIISARDDLSIEKISKRLSNEERKRLMTVAEQLRKEGRREGKKEGMEEAAKKMLQLNMDEEQIIAVTGLSDEVLKQIKDKIN